MSNKNLITVLVKVDTISEEDKLLIERMLLVANITEYNLVNLRYYRCPSDTNLYITFGKFASLAPLIFSHGLSVIALSELNQLYDKPDNASYREQAYYQLKVLADKLKFDKLVEQHRIQLADLPTLTEEQLLNLSNLLKESNIKGFTGLNKEGKTIRVRLDSNDKETADIVINFEELLALKLAFSLLDLKEVSIDRNYREDNSNHSS